MLSIIIPTIKQHLGGYEELQRAKHVIMEIQNIRAILQLQ